jgi:hypothetical protein
LRFLDENKHCFILFDEKIVLNLELDETTGMLIVYSYVSVIHFAGKELIFEILLEANFFWKISHGATFAIDKQIQTLVSQQNCILPLKKPESFQDELGLLAT